LVTRECLGRILRKAGLGRKKKREFYVLPSLIRHRVQSTMVRVEGTLLCDQTNLFPNYFFP
jgi:hypothetical protein